MNALTVVIVSASLADRSRSRLAAEYAGGSLLPHGVKVEWIDLRQHSVLAYPQSENDPEMVGLVEQFSAADAWVLATPVYNWGPSGVLTNFLHYVLSDEREHRYCPFLLLGGAGGPRSYLALDSLARTLINEIWAVQVGPPVLAAGALADRETDALDPELQVRIQRATTALVYFTAASAALRGGIPLPAV